MGGPGRRVGVWGRVLQVNDYRGQSLEGLRRGTRGLGPPVSSAPGPTLTDPTSGSPKGAEIRSSWSVDLQQSKTDFYS